MNFGVNLPGPFRVGVNSKGRVTGGVNVGPISVSGQLGGARQAAPGVWAMSFDEAIAAAQADGFRLVSRGRVAAVVQRDWKTAATITQVRGGVAVTRSWTTVQSLLAVFVPIIALTLCAVPVILSTSR